ncbi:hypothetical protein D3C81_1567620 [compost metagenome]
MRFEPGIEQGHGNRIGFFAGGTWQAENAQSTHIVQFAKAIARQLAQRGKGFRVTEKPRFRNDHRFDQRLLFVSRALQQSPILIGMRRLRECRALAYGAFDDRRPYRRHIEADAFLEKVEKTLIAAHACASSCAGLSGGSGNSKVRTASSSKSLTRTHCTNPWASSRTGPR